MINDLFSGYLDERPSVTTSKKVKSSGQIDSDDHAGLGVKEIRSGLTLFGAANPD